ncbi:cytochrome c oxidase assembly protein [Reinekea sp. G2M2-21]|uniref:cytochrome c oxidase assembly protein n=1 Tax=Reinekea sp. G2M2-21 TaxID=2788942 RepID=UPI0018AB17A4|nr:cytochrome c oxidase assembly protein [Reinekea sp. G2M2-21]
MTEQIPEPKSHLKVVLTSVVVVIGMVMFVFLVLRPMYYLICEWTGITGSQFEVQEARNFEVQMDRPIKVQFLAMNNATMSWQFRPIQNEVIAYPGQQVQIAYFARNGSPRDMVAQAVPSLSPYEATNFFIKTECFCFNQQPLAAGEETEMGLVFQIDPDLPDWVKTISLTYTLFDVTEKEELAANY